MEDNPIALRIMTIRSLIVGLHEAGLADRICEIYEVDQDDLAMLAWIEDFLKQLQPPPKDVTPPRPLLT